MNKPQEHSAGGAGAVARLCKKPAMGFLVHAAPLSARALVPYRRLPAFVRWRLAGRLLRWRLAPIAISLVDDREADTPARLLLLFRLFYANRLFADGLAAAGRLWTEKGAQVTPDDETRRGIMEIAHGDVAAGRARIEAFVGRAGAAAEDGVLALLRIDPAAAKAHLGGLAPAARRKLTTHVAVLERRGDDIEAPPTASTGAGAAAADPLIFAANRHTLAGRHDEALACVNRVLAAHGVAPIAPRTPAAPLTVANVAAAAPAAPEVDGPLVTVIMVVKDVEAYIEAAVGSVLAQTWRRLELIIIDDASTDATYGKLQRLQAADDRIAHLQRMARSAGPYVGRNTALKLARGALITFHDGDDWSHPEKIARQAAGMLGDERYVASTSSWMRLADDGLFIDRMGPPYLRTNRSSLMFRAEAAREIGDFCPWPCGADSEWEHRLSLRYSSLRILRLAAPLALAAHRDDSLTMGLEYGDGQSGFAPLRQRLWEKGRRHYRQLARGEGAFKLDAGDLPKMLAFDTDDRTAEAAGASPLDQISG